jgi:hypothetical protein
MRPAGTGDYVRDFVEEILRTALMLGELVEDLVESMPEDAFPGESNGKVVLEMLIGSIRPVADAAGEQSVRIAVGLLAASRARTIADLRRAAELAERRECQAGRRRSGRRTG